jgi:hypothetical protein
VPLLPKSRKNLPWWIRIFQRIKDGFTHEFQKCSAASCGMPHTRYFKHRNLPYLKPKRRKKMKPENIRSHDKMAKKKDTLIRIPFINYWKKGEETAL